MNLYFSIIIPVYNRPDELDELLHSLANQHFKDEFQVLVIEDGSSVSSKNIVAEYNSKINIQYFSKENSGPGSSRNFGMEKAEGNYFIILDSDCVLPKEYLSVVAQKLTANFTDAYGGPDASDTSFSVTQKAISYAMTSMLTTGGIRGNKNLKKFQPRSFNMGLSHSALEKTGGYAKMYFGEDIDLTFRLWKAGLESQFIEKAYVYHKRRTNWISFYKQTFNFGAARPILNLMHAGTAKLTYWFPTLYCMVFLVSLLFLSVGWHLLLWGIIAYWLLIFLDAFLKTGNLFVAFSSLIAVNCMFVGYGIGFMRSMFRLHILKLKKEKTFPKMFAR